MGNLSGRIAFNRLNTSSSASDLASMPSSSTMADCILHFCWLVKFSLLASTVGAAATLLLPKLPATITKSKIFTELSPFTSPDKPAGNFGKSNVAAAPTVLANKLTFTTQQKRSIQSAIVELEGIPVRSEVEELAFNLLIAILPDRLPEYTQLLPNYPNPFNPETWIPFELSQDSKVLVTIYNVAGTPVRSISMGYLQAGSYVKQSRAIYWDGGKADTGERVASGTYFYTLKIADYVSTQKMIILK